MRKEERRLCSQQQKQIQVLLLLPLEERIILGINNGVNTVTSPTIQRIHAGSYTGNHQTRNPNLREKKERSAYAVTSIPMGEKGMGVNLTTDQVEFL